MKPLPDYSLLTESFEDEEKEVGGFRLGAEQL